MHFAISNIAWNSSEDEFVYNLLQEYGIKGLEIAPTRLINNQPYIELDKAKKISMTLKKEYGLAIPSMQSILFGRNEKLFGEDAERSVLKVYLFQAIDFAETIQCKNLVFGSPKNRAYESIEDTRHAIPFFYEVANYAHQKKVVINIEANPTIYGTNYINSTAEAADLVRCIGHPGFGINLDVGAMVQNQEEINTLESVISLINHVHVSEPYLAPISPRKLHRQLFHLLKEKNFDGYVSIEMKRDESDSIGNVRRAIEYLLNI